MRRILCVALLACATLAHAQSKKELVAKLLAAQKADMEALAKDFAERPALQLLQAAGQIVGQQVPADKREAAGNAIKADIRQYVDEAVPLLRERTVRLAPQVLGPVLEEKFSEAELKQLVAWFESPVNRKYRQALPEMQNALIQRMVADAGPVLDPKLQQLQQKVRATLAANGAAGGPTPPAAASGPGGK